MLDFLGIDKYDEEGTNIIKRVFYHKECIPSHLKELVPSKEKINSYLKTNNVGNQLNVELSKRKAQKTRLKPKQKFKRV